MCVTPTIKPLTQITKSFLEKNCFPFIPAPWQEPIQIWFRASSRLRIQHKICQYVLAKFFCPNFYAAYMLGKIFKNKRKKGNCFRLFSN